MIQFDEHIFQMGWNHKLDYVFFKLPQPQKLSSRGESESDDRTWTTNKTFLGTSC